MSLVENLTVMVMYTDNERIGLFGWLGSRSSVKNVGLENVNVTGVYYVGGLVGYLSGTIANCYATGKVTGDSTIGGLVGINWGATVTDSYSSINVTGKSRVGGHVGCLANGGVIKNCYALGSVIGNSDVGGLVGENFNSSGTITNSYYDKETSGLSSISILGIGKAVALALPVRPAAEQYKIFCSKSASIQTQIHKLR